MGIQHSTIIHPVELVAREDNVVFSLLVFKVSNIFTNSIGCPLVPVIGLVGLFSRQDLNKAVAKGVEDVGIGDVVVE